MNARYISHTRGILLRRTRARSNNAFTFWYSARYLVALRPRRWFVRNSRYCKCQLPTNYRRGGSRKRTRYHLPQLVRSRELFTSTFHNLYKLSANAPSETTSRAKSLQKPVHRASHRSACIRYRKAMAWYCQGSAEDLARRRCPDQSSAEPHS